MDAGEAKRLLDALAASPRRAGSREEDAARAICAEHLAASGFRVTEESFSYSAFPGAVATPLCGLIALSLFTSAAVLAAGGRVVQTWWLVVLHAGLVGVVAAASTARGVRGLPFMRRRSVNLVGRSGDAGPALWLVAHLDSKSQPVSIAVRAGGVALVIASACALVVVLAVVDAARARVPLTLVAVSGALGSVALMLSVVRNASHGALDNASGVAAVLLAARAIQERRSGASGSTCVGVAITSAEELALAGAHALAGARSASRAINVDSVDDVGRFIVLSGRSAGGGVHAALQHSMRRAETSALEKRMLVGILVDSLALEAAGWEAVTLGRGNIASLSRIHTRSDVREAMNGQGVLRAAQIVSGASLHLLGLSAEE